MEMKNLKLYKEFISSLLEKRDLKTRQSITVSKKIVDFLKKYNFKYTGPGDDSKIFISFKTGDFETIIPSRALGGSQYTSPQGFYCFDMNGFKQRLFGDDEISPENFNPDNLSRSNNVISDLGLGYGNNGNKVDSENIWNNLNNIPRYLYFVKVKEGSLILSSNSVSRKILDPLQKLLKQYSHMFLKDSTVERFDPKDKRDNGLDKMSWREIKNYFIENKDKYKSSFIGRLLDLFKSIDKDEKDIHASMYNFILYSCCGTINSENKYVRFTVMSKSIGIDGYTQRKNKEFIHPSPEFQTILLTESCVEDIMKIDLKKELRVDKYVTDEKSKKDLPQFFQSLRAGDILFNKKLSRYVRFKDEEDFKQRETTARNIINPNDWVKVNLGENKIWQFIKSLKSGDWIKISCVLEESNFKKVLSSMIIGFEEVNVNDSEVNFKLKGKRFLETVKNSTYINYQTEVDKKTNQKFDYNLEKSDSQTPLFTPEVVNPPKWKYWLDNKSELESKGLKFEDIVDEHELEGVVKSLDELFTNKKYTYDDNRVRIWDDMDLLGLLTSFSKGYINRVFYNSKSFQKDTMTLLFYRGDLTKPVKVMLSSNPQF